MIRHHVDTAFNSINRRFVRGFVMASSLAFASVAGAGTPHFDAKIFDLKDHSKHLFNYKSEYEMSGDTKTIVNTVTDLEGKVLVVETTVLKDGGKTFVSLTQDQKQLQTLGKVEVRDGRAYFEFTKDGKKKDDDESVKSDFIVTSTLVQYLQNNWDKVAKGEKVGARLAVLDRKETIGFEFKKESDKAFSGQPGIVVKMKASNPIIAAIVDPLHFGFSADGKVLHELEGRTNVKVMVDGKYKDFDGYTVYTYPPAKK